MTLTSKWPRWRLKSPAAWLFTQSFIQAQIKENIKAPRHWPLCGEFTGTGEFPAQRASNAENVSIWWRHHDLGFFGYMLWVRYRTPASHCSGRAEGKRVLSAHNILATVIRIRRGFVKIHGWEKQGNFPFPIVCMFCSVSFFENGQFKLNIQVGNPPASRMVTSMPSPEMELTRWKYRVVMMLATWSSRFYNSVCKISVK